MKYQKSSELMRKLAVAVLTASLAALAASRAQAAGVGTSGADFLNVGVGARAQAMGGAFAAVDTNLDANVVNWNPGALGFVDKANVTASYNSLFVDENQGFVAYAAPISDVGTLAAGVNYLMVSNIEKRAADTESADSTFSNDNYAVNLSYGKVLWEKWSLGANLKYIHETMEGFSGNAMALDFGALYRTPIQGLSAGLAVSNLGSKIGPDALPLTAKGGAAYKMFGDKLVFDTDLDWLATEKTAYWSLGGEYWMHPNLAVRAGYQFGHGADQLQSSLVGLGVGLGFRIQGFTLDYAFLPYGDLGDTHRITLGWRFQ